MINTVFNKYFPSKKQLKSAPERTPIKHIRNFQIVLDQRSQKLKPLKKRDAEVWRWVLFVTERTRSDAMLRRAASPLRSIQNIQTLYLYHWRSHITDSDLQHLCNSLKRHESLRHLRVFVSGCPRITDKGLYHLGQSLKRLSRLEDLTINFGSCWSITNKAVLELSKGLKALICLRKVSLSLANCPRVKELGIKNLSEGLKRLRRLENINFDFSNCAKIDDKELESIREILKRHVNLQRVCLRFLNCQKITNTGLEYLSQGLENLEFLEEIVLRFSWFKRVNDEGLESLVKSLGRLKELKEVDFWFFECGITKAGEQKAREALKDVKNVKLVFPKQRNNQVSRFPRVVKKKLIDRILKLGLIFLLFVWILTYFVNIIKLWVSKVIFQE